jgi:ABC-type multidrug transport system fused ATPase/permease subunit
VRYPRVWWGLLRLSFAREPGVTTIALVCRLLSLVTVPATALALRAAVDASTAGQMTAALVGAVVAAVAFAVDDTVRGMGHGYAIHGTDRIGLLALNPAILRDIGAIETTDHLERSDYADRITVLHGASWMLVFSAWTALDAVLHVVKLAVMLSLLGTVDPILLSLLLFAAVPLWFDMRGHHAVNRTEVDTAEDIRVQRHLFGLATDSRAGKEIRVSGAGPELARRQREAWARAHDARFRARLARAVWQVGGWSVFTAGFAGALALVVHRVSTGRGTLGDVLLAMTIAVALRGAVRDAVYNSTEAAGASGRLLEPYLWLRDYARERRAESGGDRPVPTPLREGIGLDHLTYRYPGTDRDAVTDVTVTLPAGSVVAIVGEYGSGKTTLVKLLCGFHRPAAGAIRVDGVDLSDVDTRAWWARTSVAFQDFGRYHAVFRETVGLGDLSRVEDGERVAAAVAAAGGRDLLTRLPQGIETRLGREFGGVELSEGQWQKTALARACMREEPVLFVLDEPTASLDAASERAIFEHYLARARALADRTGAITVIVSHRFSTVSGADLILVMRGGRLVEHGRHEDLVDAGGLYAQLHGLTSRAYALPTQST